MFPPPTEVRAKTPFPGRRPQGGAALIIAILVTALAAASAISLLSRTDHWIERLAGSRDKAQAYTMARAGLAYAQAILAADGRAGSLDTFTEDWARQLPPLRYEESEVAGRIEDMQGHFNLNNLRRSNGQLDPQALRAYRRLLALLGLADGLADNLAATLGGNEKTAGLTRPLDHPAQLRAIAGYSAENMRRLQDFVSVLPGQQAVNINTAPPEVLAAVQPGLSLGAARALAGQRLQQPFRDQGDFQNRLPEPNLPAPLLPLTGASRHFLIHVEVRTGRSRSRVDTLISRASERGPVHIYWQSLR